MWIRFLGYQWYIDTAIGLLSTTVDFGSFKKQRNGANVTRYLSTKQVSLTMKNLPPQTRDDQCKCGETPVDIYGGGTLLTGNEEPHELIASEHQHMVKEVQFVQADPPTSILHPRCRLLIVPGKITITPSCTTIDPIQPQWTHMNQKEDTLLRWLQRGITRQTDRHRVVLDSGTCVSYYKSTTIDFADSAQLTVFIYWMHVFFIVKRLNFLLSYTNLFLLYLFIRLFITLQLLKCYLVVKCEIKHKQSWNSSQELPLFLRTLWGNSKVQHSEKLFNFLLW